MGACATAWDWREGRRLRAWELKRQGWKQVDIARALGVTAGAVSQWMKRAREGGPEALRKRPPPGPRPRLSAEQKEQLLAVLIRGAEAYQFRGDIWTTKRVAAVIRQEFGVRYHPAHVSRVLRACGWSVQKPIKRASQRDEAAIRAWMTERWPALREGAEREGRTIVWVDESAFYLLPALVRTYAPRGHTPILRLPLTRDHLSAISGLTLDGKLVFQVRPYSLRSPDVVDFLRQLLRHLPGKLLVMWDGAPIHRARPVKDFLASSAAKRLRLEQLPGYAPELNPDEGVWNLLKRVELRNVRCQDLAHLEDELRRAAKRLRHKRDALRGCIRQVGYVVERPTHHRASARWLAVRAPRTRRQTTGRLLDISETGS